MKTVVIHGQPVRLKSDSVIGSGGEADIYKLAPDTVLKLYKQPNDPLYDNNPDAQAGAKLRLDEQQRKLLAFPTNLPVEIVAPTGLAYDKSGSRIVGYTMPLIDGKEVLLRLGDRRYRETGGIDGNSVVATFRRLHAAVDALHKQHVVLGDFNDLNVLFDDSSLRIVDADSMQYGAFMCHTYTSRFLDPLVSDSAVLQLARPLGTGSDWYAYFVMLLQSLLYVGPYGGVHRPQKGPRLQHDARVLKRLTVRHSDVMYPKPAVPLGALPDELLAYMEAVFEQDKREPFPLRLLDALRWTTCLQCGTVHARNVCPGCTAPGVQTQAVTIRGTVTARRVFATKGKLLHAVAQAGTLRYLYHENGAFYRDGGRKVLSGDLDPELRYRIQGDATLIGKRDRLFVIEPSGESRQLTADTYRGTLPMFDATARDTFWLSAGQLLRSDRITPKYLGNVLQSQTMFWVGETKGFGLYQAGQLTRAFLFEPSRHGLNDRVVLPLVKGQLVDATCAFSDTYTWFMTTQQQAGKLVHQCFVIDASGQVVASADTASDDSSWLAGGIRGHLAVGASLYVATDEGIKRVGVANGQVVVEREFPDTEPFVTSHSHLVAGPGGIHVVSTREITLLEIR